MLKLDPYFCTAYLPNFLFPGKRQDEDLIEAWRKIKEKQGVDFNVLFDKSDLDRWDHSDFALGLFSMSDMDYVRAHHMLSRILQLRIYEFFFTKFYMFTFLLGALFIF